jgi:hypothetical protein
MPYFYADYCRGIDEMLRNSSGTRLADKKPAVTGFSPVP